MAEGLLPAVMAAAAMGLPAERGLFLRGLRLLIVPRRGQLLRPAAHRHTAMGLLLRQCRGGEAPDPAGGMGVCAMSAPMPSMLVLSTSTN